MTYLVLRKGGYQILDRLAADLQREFPDQRGGSTRNLKYTRAMADAWPDAPSFGQQAVALCRGHVTVLLSRLDAREDVMVALPGRSAHPA